MAYQGKGLKVVCVGAGYFSQFHHQAWRRLAGVDLVGVADQDVTRAAQTGHPAFADVATMLEATEPDIIDIVTPPHTHAELIALACEHGAKAIICQKPFCGQIDAAEQAVAQAKQAGIPLIVHENFRFQPWFRTIRQAIDRGAIGDVLQMTYRLRPGDGQGADAYLARQPYFQTMPKFLIHETGAHYIDVFRFLFGEPEAVFADLRKMNPVIAGEDAGTVLFYYANGVRALLDANRLLDHAAPNLRCTMGEALVEGTAGCLVLSGNGSVSHRKFAELEFTQLLPPASTPNFGGDCVYHLQAHVIDALVNGAAFENLAEDYLQVIRQELLIYESAKCGSRLAVNDGVISVG